MIGTGLQNPSRHRFSSQCSSAILLPNNAGAGEQNTIGLKALVPGARHASSSGRKAPAQS